MQAKKLFTNLDMQGNQLMQAVLEHRAPSAPFVEGRVSYDPAAQMGFLETAGGYTYFPMSNAAGAYVVGAPDVRLVTNNNNAQFRDQQGNFFVLPPVNTVSIRAQNLPKDFFTDPKLDAAIDLFVYRNKRHAGASRQLHGAGFRHPVSYANGQTEDDIRIANGIIPAKSMLRGGRPHGGFGDRHTNWPLLNYANTQEVVFFKNFEPEAFFQDSKLETINADPAIYPGGNVGLRVKALAASGRTTRLNYRYQYGSVQNSARTLYFSFAYSWIDKNAPDPRQRIVGPMSPIFQAKSEHWFQRNTATGFIEPNTKQERLVLSAIQTQGSGK